MPEIDSALNLVLPIRYREVEAPHPDRPDEKIKQQEAALWAYHTPITQEVFRANYRVIAATKDALFKKGTKYALETGLPVCDLMLLDAAKADAAEWQSADSGPAIIAELRLRTQVLAPGPMGFEYLPLDVAIARGVIDADEARDVERVLVFFMCASRITMSANRESVADSAASVFGGSMTSLSPTEFTASLPTSTPAVDLTPPIPSLLPS